MYKNEVILLATGMNQCLCLLLVFELLCHHNLVQIPRMLTKEERVFLGFKDFIYLIIPKAMVPERLTCQVIEIKMIYSALLKLICLMICLPQFSCVCVDFTSMRQVPYRVYIWREFHNGKDARLLPKTYIKSTNVYTPFIYWLVYNIGCYWCRTKPVWVPL